MSAPSGAIARSLDQLLEALRLVPAGDGQFAVRAEPGRFAQVFGGQLLAQALVAAAETVPGKAPQSLHASFVRAGIPGEDLSLRVRPLRDGRSTSARGVDVVQDGRVLLSALVSFHDLPVDPQRTPGAPAAELPESMPSLQEWAARAPAALAGGATVWIDTPPPLEIRLPEALAFLGGAPAPGPRSHWMRLPRAVDAPVLDCALLAYASDYFLLDMAFRSRDEPFSPATVGLSLDHAIWFHRPVRFDCWHLFTQETLVLGGERGLVRGSVHDLDGALVASVVQEVLVRDRLEGESA